jgi:hypothetical protein
MRKGSNIMYKANIDRNEFGYYVQLEYSYYNLEIDQMIAQHLNISADYYQKYLADNFNGDIIYFESGNRYEVYFKNKIDANKAVEWVDSLLIAKQLYVGK